MSYPRPTRFDAVSGLGGVDSQPHRKLFDKLMKDSNAVMKPTDCKAFLQACIDLPDENEFILRLASPEENGTKQIIAACTGGDNYNHPNFINNSVLPLLRRIFSDSNSRGMAKSKRNQLIAALLKQLVMREYILEILPIISDPIPFAQLVHDVLLSEGDGEIRQSLSDFVPHFLSGCSRTKFVEHVGFTNILESIQNIIQPRPQTTSASPYSSASSRPATHGNLADAYAGPGGRHDNDKANYRDIQLVPTEEEIVCQQAPYLPVSNESLTVGKVLDRNFRLLREDLLGPLREEFKEGPRFQYDDARVLNYFTGRIIKDGKSRQASSNGYFEVTFRHRLPIAAKPVWWEKHPRALQRHALVCMMHAETKKPYCFGQVWDRDEKKLGDKSPMIGILPCSPSEVWIFLWLWQTNTPTILVHCNASYFASQPILRELQKLSSLPFEDELIGSWQNRSRTNTPQHYQQYAHIIQQLHASGRWEAEGKAIMLDESQRQAMINGLSQRVCLIQGPPGTGQLSVTLCVCRL